MLNKLRSKARGLTAEKSQALDAFSGFDLTGQERFVRMLYLEEKRTERSTRPFVLMLVHLGPRVRPGGRSGALEKVVSALTLSTRETDVKGWYKWGSTIGIVFTELSSAEVRAVADALQAKIGAALSAALSADERGQIRLSCHIFPEDWHDEGPGNSGGLKQDEEWLRSSEPRKRTLMIKTCVDVAGSLLALGVLSPVMLAIAVAIKLTSKGPIIFRQQRVGKHGRKFTFLKFRSMYTANDPRVHQEFVKRLIAGKVVPDPAPGNAPHSYKLKADARVTPVGRFLRKTSLDELPQFFNVLKREMSLVGPRPPIPYEVECYDIWHKRRLLIAKPGITGLWQVNGRSKTTFNEMVRLDLQYAESWSLWLDIKILLQTPRAILSGEGAY